MLYEDDFVLQVMLDPADIDGMVHGKVRLAILAFLSTARSAEFTLLKKQLSITDGNLAVNLRKLEEAKYITSTKEFVDRRPRTTLTITLKGRSALLTYLDQMKTIIESIDN